jgi:hypothetical protein
LLLLLVVVMVVFDTVENILYHHCDLFI